MRWRFRRGRRTTEVGPARRRRAGGCPARRRTIDRRSCRAGGSERRGRRNGEAVGSDLATMPSSLHGSGARPHVSVAVICLNIATPQQVDCHTDCFTAQFRPFYISWSYFVLFIYYLFIYVCIYVFIYYFFSNYLRLVVFLAVIFKSMLSMQN